MAFPIPILSPLQWTLERNSRPQWRLRLMKSNCSCNLFHISVLLGVSCIWLSHLDQILPTVSEFLPDSTPIRVQCIGKRPNIYSVIVKALWTSNWFMVRMIQLNHSPLTRMQIMVEIRTMDVQLVDMS